MVNVGKYTIHGSYGLRIDEEQNQFQDTVRAPLKFCREKTKYHFWQQRWLEYHLGMYMACGDLVRFLPFRTTKHTESVAKTLSNGGIFEHVLRLRGC